MCHAICYKEISFNNHTWTCHTSTANNPKPINTVALRNYFKEIPPTPLITFLLSTPTLGKLHLTCMFLLALAIDSERGLYLHDEGYVTDANYDLSQPLMRIIHIYTVTAVDETTFNLMGPQESKMHTLMSTPKGRLENPPLQLMTCRCLSFSDAPPSIVNPNDNDVWSE